MRLKSLLFLVETIKKKEKSLFLILGLLVLFSSANIYIYNFLIKCIFEVIEFSQGEYKFFFFLSVFFVANYVINIVIAKLNCTFTWKIIKCRYSLVSSLTNKMLSIKYIALEKTKILDEFYKALNLINNPLVGIEAAIRNTVGVLSMAIQIVIGFIIIGHLYLWVVFGIIVMFTIRFYVVTVANKKDKKLVWDKLSPLWRKQYYFKDIGRQCETARDIRIFDLSYWIIEKLQNINVKILQKQRQSMNIWNRNHIARIAIDIIISILFYGGLIGSTIKNGFSISNFIYYIAIMTNLEMTLDKFAWEIASFNRNLTELSDYINFINNKSYDFKEFGDSFLEKSNKFQPKQLRFEHVYFKYPGNENFVLYDICLSIKLGKSLALVGENGAGKTTILKLICRLYSPTKGKIYLDNINIEKIQISQYYKFIAPMFQDNDIYAFSILENISMKIKKYTDYKCVENLLKKLDLWESVNMKKDGVNSEMLFIITSSGINLSGGERQKLTLARALYKNSAILLLDEPTMSLDALAEDNFYRLIKKVAKKKALIYVTHRLVSTKFCDEIILLSHGKVVEKGTHNELIELGKIYANMFMLQKNHYLEKEEIK